MGSNLATDLDTEMSRLKQTLDEKGIDPCDERTDLPSSLVREDISPIRGSIHISTGRVISRIESDEMFSKVDFAKI